VPSGAVTGETSDKEDIEDEETLTGISCLVAGASSSAVIGVSDTGGCSTTAGVAARGGAVGIGVSVGCDICSRAGSTTIESAR